MTKDGEYVYAIKSIDKDTGVAFAYGTGVYCSWLEPFDSPGVILEDHTAIPISTDCFALTPEEVEPFDIKFVEQEQE